MIEQEVWDEFIGTGLDEADCGCCEAGGLTVSKLVDEWDDANERLIKAHRG